MCGWCDARTHTIDKSSFDLGIYHLLSTIFSQTSFLLSSTYCSSPSLCELRWKSSGIVTHWMTGVAGRVHVLNGITFYNYSSSFKDVFFGFLTHKRIWLNILTVQLISVSCYISHTNHGFTKKTWSTQINHGFASLTIV